MAQGDGRKSQADIARDYMIAHAKEVAGKWQCKLCGAVTEFPAESCSECGSPYGTTRPRFPSAPETRQAILDDISRRNEKYARPFDEGAVARASLVGTESWAEYGEVVLQMATLDTLLSIEAKLAALLERLGDGQSQT
jgi:hypothetical protein